MTGIATTFQSQAPNLGRPRRSHHVVIAIVVILILFFLLPIVPVSTQIGLFIGKSPNCTSSADCEVNQSGVTLQGYGSASYVLFGVGVPTSYSTTATVVLATETNASTGQVLGHTAYTITVKGGLDTLQAVANTTAGTVRYGCAYVIPNDGAAGITTHPSYTSYSFADGTVVQYSNC